MEIHKAEFLQSNSDFRKCPAPLMPEYAFAGRSNVGKSSLINYITGRKSLAKTSSTPGKTQLVNHFLIDDAWYLVDLPGYGYAKYSKEGREAWAKLVYAYLEFRKNLMCVMQLVDARHAPQKNDLEFMEWMGKREIPFVLLFTKTDKLSKTKLAANLEHYEAEMLKRWEIMPQQFYTSASAKVGAEGILRFIEETNTLFKQPA